MSRATAPYPGLRPYREDEHRKFFGRNTDKAILVDKILGNRLTLLFAASGVGKSSLLQAAVIPQLKAASGENLTVVCNTDWVSEPIERVRTSVLTTLQTEQAHEQLTPDNDSLVAALELGSLLVRRAPLVLILDQFEEFFRYQRHGVSFQAFIDQLTAAINDTALPVSVVISMREDFAMELNTFKPGLPNLLFENYYRLEKLTRQAARQAILDPVHQLGCDYEPALLERLLQDLQDRKREQLSLPHVISTDSVDSVDPPYLQIVCAYLWRLKPAQETTLRLASYEQAGGVEGILRYFLDDALNHLTHADKQLASQAFDYLAAQRGLKMAYPVDVLARILRVKPLKLDKVLAKLAKRDMNILRDQTRNGVVWYELYHDMFADSIEQWNNRWKAQRQKRQRWLVGSIIVVLAVIIGLLIDSFLWIYRNNFPADYLFQEQKFRLMHWDLLPKPYPKTVSIPASATDIQVGELDQAFGEMANKFLQEQGSYNLQNFGYPPIAATISSAFEMGQYEVTYEQYDYYVWQQRGEGKQDIIYPTGATRDNGRGQRAVTQVSWSEALAYTQWLSQQTEQTYRLPTEVEWEYAARAGSTTPYWWGDQGAGLNKANCDGCGSVWDNLLVAPVGSFVANPWGLYDTAGNVWEWTCSEWQPELGTAAQQCATDEASNRRVIRGGSWNDNTGWVRSAARLRDSTSYRGDDIGFRVLRIPRQDK
ncbi:MAG: formylglycine-generating enzyme family protein [Thiolinea sp.]